MPSVVQAAHHRHGWAAERGYAPAAGGSPRCRALVEAQDHHSLAVRVFALAAAADDGRDVDVLAAGHRAMRGPHAAAAGEFWDIIQPPSRVQTGPTRGLLERDEGILASGWCGLGRVDLDLRTQASYQ